MRAVWWRGDVNPCAPHKMPCTGIVPAPLQTGKLPCCIGTPPRTARPVPSHPSSESVCKDKRKVHMYMTPPVNVTVQLGNNMVRSVRMKRGVSAG